MSALYEGVGRLAHFVRRLNIIWITEDTMSPLPCTDTAEGGRPATTIEQ